MIDIATDRPAGGARLRSPIALAALVAVGLSGAPAGAQDHAVTPAAGMVPNAETAIAIAVAVWTPIYGAERIQRQRPYTATLENGHWTVQGSLPRGVLGGVAVAVIARTDGRVLRVSHGR